MRELVVGPAKSVVRIFAQVKKELIQVRRRPGAFFSLILGPFLIMAVFGLGFTGARNPLLTALVIPADLGLPADPDFYQQLVGSAMTVASVSDLADQPRADLAAERLDLVVVVPADARQIILGGQRATIEVDLNQTDPVSAAYVASIAQLMNQKINEEVITQVIAGGKAFATGTGVDQVADISPELVAAPTDVRVNNIAPSQPSVVGFAAPAALALMLQHMAVTLTALSFVRERFSGAMELIRISPVNSLELVLGKYIGLGIVSTVVATISVVLLVAVLGVPMLGSVWLVATVIGLLILASLGLGLIISVVSDSERQAVQLALLLLLASVFFSGFVLPVSQFHEGVQFASYALPVTHGIRVLQDVMLRGQTTAEWQLVALAGLAALNLVVTVILLRRQMRNA